MVEEVAAADLGLVMVGDVWPWLAFVVAFFGGVVGLVEVFAVIVGEEVVLGLDWLWLRLLLGLLVVLLLDSCGLLLFLLEVVLLLEALVRLTLNQLLLLYVFLGLKWMMVGLFVGVDLRLIWLFS